MSETKYVSCNMMGHMGRLGNQMFQYAALTSLADRLKCVPLINYDRKMPCGGDLLHKMTIDECFNLSVTRESNHSPYFLNSSLGRWREGTHHYDAGFTYIDWGTDIVGYFQDEKYFCHIADKIRKEFTFKDDIESKAQDIWNKRPSEIVVSLHIRRGDYLDNPQYHPSISLDYCKRCLEIMTTAVGKEDMTVAVFSDDIGWCKEVFESISSKFWIQENDQFTDLCLMTKCDHHIIANSSFSWWGAWLCTNTDKKVFYPSGWFGKQSHLQHRNGAGENSICPSEWNCIDIEDKTVPSTPHQPDPIIGL